MAKARILIDPLECRITARHLESNADETRSLIGDLANSGVSLPAMPTALAAIVGERICHIDADLARIADDLEVQARALEITARILELDQAVASVAWGSLALDAAFDVVNAGVSSYPRAAQLALERLLETTDLTRLSVSDWKAIAYFKAGIDASVWRPDLGLAANDAVIRAAYAYYARLWLDDRRFQWAGMANLAGTLFYGRWQDLYALRHVADDGQRMSYLAQLADIPALPEWAYDAADLADLGTDPMWFLEHLGSEELAGFEVRFLRMQKEIFDDLAWQHEVYKHGGIELMRKLAREGDISNEILGPWETMAKGDPASIAAANTRLLRREQERIIQDDYRDMRAHHGPVGDAFTYLMTWTADSPIPGGGAYRDVVTRVFRVGLDTPELMGYDPPDAAIGITLPRGNVAEFKDRWLWIEMDMLPTYHAALEDGTVIEDLVRTPVRDRAKAFRMIDALPYP